MLKKVNDSLYGRVKGSVYNSVYNIVLNVLFVLAALSLVFEIYFSVVYCGIYVVHSSMSPTLNGAVDYYSAGGDYIYINRRASAGYGDIVVVRSGGQNIIKRAVAFGGDTVKIEGGQLYIMYGGDSDYTLIDEWYVSPSNNTPTMEINNYTAHTVAENCFFLLGDNRNVSSDSRQNGDYPVSDLVGVLPAWSYNVKSFTTALHTFFHFTLPEAFGAG